jgi:hypothetical protein
MNESDDNLSMLYMYWKNTICLQVKKIIKTSLIKSQNKHNEQIMIY